MGKGGDAEDIEACWTHGKSPPAITDFLRNAEQDTQKGTFETAHEEGDTLPA
jgi:hypothetical protein